MDSAPVYEHYPIQNPERGDDNLDQNQKHETFVIECVVLDTSILLPLRLDIDVETVANRAYAEYQAIHPTAPPMKVVCVTDDDGRVMSKALRLDEHELGTNTFHIRVEEYSDKDILGTSQQLDGEYRRWQFWIVRQIYDTLKAALVTQFTASTLEPLRSSHERIPTNVKGSGRGQSASHSLIDEKMLDLLSEISYSPDLQVKLMCLETMALLRMHSHDDNIVQAASGRIARYVQDEQANVQVVAYGLHAYRANAKGLLPLSPFHEQEVTMLHRMFRIDVFNDILSRFPSKDDQKALMVAYKNMYIHHYDIHAVNMHLGMNGGRSDQGSLEVALNRRPQQPPRKKLEQVSRTRSSAFPSFLDNEDFLPAARGVGIFPAQAVNIRQRPAMDQDRDIEPATQAAPHQGLLLSAEAVRQPDMPHPSYVRSNTGRNNDASDAVTKYASPISGEEPATSNIEGASGLSRLRLNVESNPSFAYQEQHLPRGPVNMMAATAGMTISRICNLLVSEEQSVWKFAVKKLYVMLQTAQHSARQVSCEEVASRRMERRQAAAVQRQEWMRGVRRLKYDTLEKELEATLKVEKAALVAKREEAQKVSVQERALAEQKEKARLEKLGKKAQMRLEKEAEEEARLKALSARDKPEQEVVLEANDPVSLLLKAEEELVLSTAAKRAELSVRYQQEEQESEALYQRDLRDDYESTFQVCPSLADRADFRSLFLSNAEVDLLVTCLFDCLKMCVDTRAKGVYSGTAARSAFGGSAVASSMELGNRLDIANGGGAPGVKNIIAAALLSPLTDLPTLRRIIHCLYLLALPIKLDPLSDVTAFPFRGNFSNHMQVSVAKVCLARARILLTLCHAESNIIAGKCAYLLHLGVRYNAKKMKEESKNRDSISEDNTTSLDDGWSGLDVKLEPLSLIDFVMCQSKRVAVDLRDDNYNRNKSDSVYSYFGIEDPNIHANNAARNPRNRAPSTAQARDSGDEDVEEEELNTYSKHLVSLALDYIYSLTQVHDTGSHAAILANTNVDVSARRHPSEPWHKMARDESRELIGVAAEARLVKQELRAADKEFDQDDDDGYFPYVPGPLPTADKEQRDGTPSSLYSVGRGQGTRGQLRRKQSNNNAAKSPSKGLKMGAMAIRESEKMLHNVFLGDHYKYLLRLWHLVTFSTPLDEMLAAYRVESSRKYASREAQMKAETAAAEDAQEILFEYIISMQHRRLALEILSHLCTLSTAFRDQLQRINAVPKLIVLVGSPGIVAASPESWNPYGGHRLSGNIQVTNPETKDPPKSVRYGEAEETTSKVPLGKDYLVDVGTIRSSLRLLLNLVVLQTPVKQATIIRLLQEVPIGGEKFGLSLRKVVQTDETSAFYLSTLVALEILDAGDRH